MKFQSAAGLFVGIAISGCNQIFGIVEPEDGTNQGGSIITTDQGGAGGSGATGGTGGTGGSGASGGTGGSGGGGMCLPERPNTCENGTLTDPENCCIQGRSCQGGACEDGTCRATLVAASTNPLEDEVLDVITVGSHLFWSSGSGQKLYRTSTDGGTVTEHATSNDNPTHYITRLAADADYVYYTNFGSGRIVRVPVEGGGLEIVTEVPDSGTTPEAGFSQIAVGGNKVFFRLEQPGGVYYAPLSNLPSTAVMLDTSAARGLAADETHVYWATDPEARTIVRLPFSDLQGTPETVFSGTASIVEMEVVKDRVYFSAYDAVTLRSAIKDGQNKLVVALATDTVPVLGIASDGRDVFFSTSGCSVVDCPPGIKGHVYRVPVLGGTIEDMLETTGFGDIRAIQMDCDTVYIANGADRSILKMTR